MKEAEIPGNDAQRLAALRNLCMLDTDPEERFDRLTRLAAALFKVPVAVVSLVDVNRQWFKSSYGLKTSQTPRNISFCGHVVYNDAPLIIPDVLQDERFSDNPLVTGEPHTRFYAGYPLRTYGLAVGSFCIIDVVPRTLSESELEFLQDLARMVEDQLHYGDMVKMQNLLTEINNALLAEVSNRKRAEATARASDALTSAILDGSLDAVISMDANGVVTRWNRQAESIFGWSSAEAIGKPLGDIIIPEAQRAAYAQSLRTYLNTGRGPLLNRRVEMTALRRDGTSFTIESSISVSRRDDEATFNAFISDIEERKRQEQALKESEAKLTATKEQLELAVSGTSDGIWDLNLITGEVYFSPRWKEQLGYQDHELPSKQEEFHNRIHPDDLERVKTAVRRHLESMDKYDVEFRMRNRAGEYIWIRSRGRAVCDANGKMIRMAGGHTDVTAHRMLEDQLRASEAQANSNAREMALAWRYVEKQKEELSQMVKDLAGARDKALDGTRVKSEFLAKMSHEIRTPMNGIIGMTEIMLADNMTSKQRESAQLVHSSAQALLGIIDDILDFSRIEAGKLRLDEIDFNIDDVVVGAIDTLGAVATGKGLDLNCFIHPDVAANYVGDPGRLRQILINLVGNAVKFTSAGEVSVEVTRGHEGADQSTLCFSVNDTGIGISETSRPKLFQAFVQTDDSPARRFGGSGLGLVISKQLAELMGGQIGCTSVESKGSRFWFTVRLRHSLEENTEFSRYKSLLAGRSALIVQGYGPTSRVGLASYLSALGMKTTCVRTAAEAMPAKLRDLKLDIVLIDQHLPDGDGAEVANLIAEDEALVKLKTVLLTRIGENTADDGGKFDCVMMKAIRRAALAASLCDVLGLKTDPKADLQRMSAEYDLPKLRTAMELFDGSGAKKIASVLHLLKKDAAPLLAHLNDQKATDPRKVERGAHGLKGVASEVGATNLHHACVKALESIRNGRASSLIELQRGVLVAYQRAIDTLTQCGGVMAAGTDAAETQAPSAVMQRGYRVMVVDDVELNRIVAARILQSAGYEVTCVGSGAAAIEVLEHEVFDAILMDVMMPGIDGLETTRRLRASERHREVPIIGVSASVSADNKAHCSEAGMTAFVPKPIKARELRDTLARVIAENARRAAEPATKEVHNG